MENIEICVKNNGKVVWFILPTSEEDIRFVMDFSEEQERILICDYNAPFVINETDDIQKLNNIAMNYDMYSSHPAVDYLVDLVKDGCFSNIESAFEEIESIVVHYNCNSMIDIAYIFIEESGLLSDVPEDVERYFNYEAYASDLEIEGYFYFTGNDIALQIC
ncbi:antirestriction protein ArdA [Listeria monocytogenes]|nr:antirestriction protein ArdA [Listeria monocytogenes]ECC0312012.1 antirestriction protein ArdA [Listeria monocytogenes]